MTVHTSPLLSVKSNPNSPQPPGIPTKCGFPVKACIQAGLVIIMVVTLIYMFLVRHYSKSIFRIQSNDEFREFLHYISEPPKISQQLDTSVNRGFLGCFVDVDGTESFLQQDYQTLNDTWLHECDRVELDSSRSLDLEAPYLTLFNHFDRISNPGFWRFLQMIKRVNDLNLEWNLISRTSIFISVPTLRGVLSRLDPRKPYLIRFDSNKLNAEEILVISNSAAKHFIKKGYLNDTACKYESHPDPISLLSSCMQTVGVKVLTSSALDLTVVPMSTINSKFLPMPKRLLGFTGITDREARLIRYLNFKHSVILR
ncbi:unnamed protein product [Bursaphelenchus xylophilus]|uniref:(pine wood nematode) hypothetical protein n=1 Tax=Bursaphelenchus xylophilus TaxID=6326 RepID=A0A1I7RP48_BURXY|nr:unnamed protein product [Bursaphelenchus xylophilus]CAG9124550.1 unnamed protein product [Bursaphelenchus xylophilus]